MPQKHRLLPAGSTTTAAVALMLSVLAGCQSDASSTSPTSELPSAEALSAANGTTATTLAPANDLTSPAHGEAVAPVDGPTDTGPTATGPTESATSPTTATAPVETRPEILALSGPQLDGRQFDLAATAGNDVLLWFWAPW